VFFALILEFLHRARQRRQGETEASRHLADSGNAVRRRGQNDFSTNADKLSESMVPVFTYHGDDCASTECLAC